MAINQTGDVGFGLAGHQMRRAELFQDAVVVVFIDFPLIVDSAEHRWSAGGKTSTRRFDRVFLHGVMDESHASYLTYWSLPPTAK